MKILRVIARLNIGGPARHVAVLMNGLDPAKFPTVLVTGRPAHEEGDLAELLPPNTRHRIVPQIQRAVHPLRDLLALLALCRIVWREQPDLIHTHTAKAGTLGRLAGLWYRLMQRLRGRRRRVILVHTFHGHVLSGYFGRLSTRLFVAIERWLARHTEVLIAVSPSVRDDLLRLGIGRPSQVQVVPLGLDLSALFLVDGPRHLLRERLALPADAPLVGIVGRLVPVKHLELFLDAAGRLNRRHPAMHFAVVGDGECRLQLETLTRTMGLSDRVHFFGWQTDLPGVYADLDCVCLTSRNEGTPVSLIEAMAAGRPVVATAVGGVGDLFGVVVERGEDYDIAERGLLVQLAHSAEGVAAAVERVLADAPLCYRLAEAGRAFVRQRLTAERLVADVAALYERLEQE